MLLPPPDLRATLQGNRLNRPSGSVGATLVSAEVSARRSFLKAISVGMGSLYTGVAQGSALIFSPSDSDDAPQKEMYVGTAYRGARGEISPDFWEHPRELWIRRQETRQETRVVYWRDGQLVSDGYWQACALLRDVRANLMTSMDPTILDVLRGISGYYQAWNYGKPIVVTSGFRTVGTNNALSREGAARNSMHLYGKAVDLFVPGIPQKDVGTLGMHLRQGGVGFYPDRGFTHLDTGKLRAWVGK